jgi:hypothetical protein
MVVTAAVDDAQQAILVQPLEANHRGMEPEAIRNLDHLAFGDSQFRPGAIVGGVTEWDDRVQAVVATRQLDDDEDALGMFFEAGSLERLRG